MLEKKYNILLQLSLIFDGPLRFLHNPDSILTNQLFLWRAASVLIIFTYQSPIVEGVTVDAIGRQLVQLFHYTNTVRFSCRL
jgi:hypothetical protein